MPPAATVGEISSIQTTEINKIDTNRWCGIGKFQQKKTTHREAIHFPRQFVIFLRLTELLWGLIDNGKRSGVDGLKCTRYWAAGFTYSEEN